MNIKISTTPQGRAIRAAKTKSDVDAIVATLSIEEKELLGCSEEDNWSYLSLNQGEHVLKRCIKYVDGEPVSFFDLLDDTDHINVALATAADHRGHGYASEVAYHAMNWINHHPEVRQGRDIIWGVEENNEGSIAIAVDLGFVEDPSSRSNGWVNYVDKYEQHT